MGQYMMCLNYWGVGTRGFGGVGECRGVWGMGVGKWSRPLSGSARSCSQGD